MSQVEHTQPGCYDWSETKSNERENCVSEIDSTDDRESLILMKSEESRHVNPVIEVSVTAPTDQGHIEPITAKSSDLGSVTDRFDRTGLTLGTAPQNFEASEVYDVHPSISPTISFDDNVGLINSISNSSRTSRLSPRAKETDLTGKQLTSSSVPLEVINSWEFDALSYSTEQLDDVSKIRKLISIRTGHNSSFLKLFCCCFIISSCSGFGMHVVSVWRPRGIHYPSRRHA